MEKSQFDEFQTGYTHFSNSSLAGETIGLIALPSHSARVAWHSCDQLVRQLGFNSKLSPPRIREAGAGVQACHFLSILPGLVVGETFVYADTLSFFATAMVRDQDSEPRHQKGQASLMLAKRIWDKREATH